MTKKIINGGAIVLIILIAAFYYHRYRMAPEMDFNRLELTDLNNAPVKLESFKGKKQVINFFATWCGPCIREIIEFGDVQAILKNENFVFICISDEPVERLQGFRERMPQNVLILHSVAKFDGINIYTFPTSYLIGENERVIFKKTGELNLDADALAAELKQLTH